MLGNEPDCPVLRLVAVHQLPGLAVTSKSSPSENDRSPGWSPLKSYSAFAFPRGALRAIAGGGAGPLVGAGPLDGGAAAAGGAGPREGGRLPKDGPRAGAAAAEGGAGPREGGVAERGAETGEAGEAAGEGEPPRLRRVGKPPANMPPRAGAPPPPPGLEPPPDSSFLTTGADLSTVTVFFKFFPC